MSVHNYGVARNHRPVMLQHFFTVFGVPFPFSSRRPLRTFANFSCTRSNPRIMAEPAVASSGFSQLAIAQSRGKEGVGGVGRISRFSPWTLALGTLDHDCVVPYSF